MKRQRSARSIDVQMTTIDVLADHVAIIDASGLIVAVNVAWLNFARANGGDLSCLSTGINYLDVCDRARSRGNADAAVAAAAIRSVIDGKCACASMEYQCDAPCEQRWFKLKVTHSLVSGPPHFVLAHENIAAPVRAEQRLRFQEHLLASVEQAVIATDPAGTILYWNPFAERMYGWTADEVLGRNVVGVITFESSRVQADEILAQLQQGQSWSGEFEVRHRSGRPLMVHVTNSPVRDERNRLVGIIGISTDIGERKDMEKALRLSDMVCQAIGDAIMVLDADGQVVAINPAFTRLTGYAEDEIVQRPVNLLTPDEGEHFLPVESQPLLEKTGHWAGAVRTRCRHGGLRRDWLRVDTSYDKQGRVKARICLFSRITEQKRAKETIWQQANFDALTGLPNRSMFRDRLDHELHQAGRDGRRVALMFVDLDQFKEVNDTLGHEMGDQLLQLAAERLPLCVREVDTVARLGGDEFTVILGQLGDAGIVDRVARDIVRTLAEPFHLGQNAITVSASVGIALYPADAADADTLVKHADQAMYAAKLNGRNQFHYFTQAMQEEAQRRLRTVDELREALAHEQFEVYYQPIVELATGAIHRAEALLRWRHPQRGLISPGEFIALAEQTGMIGPIGAWVYAHVTEQARRWRHAIDPQFLVSINVSPVQLRTSGHAGASTASPGPAGRSDRTPVIVEIAEGPLLDACAPVLEHLQVLRDAGIELAIDDFGTGHAALSCLRKFHVDYLKIDPTVVSKLAAHSADLSLCEAIIVMAHKLGIKVIAEGVERGEQRALLARAGCDFGQGYLFARPMSAERMERMLRG